MSFQFLSSSPNPTLNLWIPLGPQSALAAHPAQTPTLVHYDRLLRHITPSLPFLPSAISIPTSLHPPCPNSSSSNTRLTPPPHTVTLPRSSLPMPPRHPLHRCTSPIKILRRCPCLLHRCSPIAAASPSMMVTSSRVRPRKRDDDKL